MVEILTNNLTPFFNNSHIDVKKTFQSKKCDTDFFSSMEKLKFRQSILDSSKQQKIFLIHLILLSVWVHLILILKSLYYIRIF